jgi:hypothetical protein
MKKLRLLALMAVAALLLIFPAIVLGQPVPPHVSKLVVSVDGNPAADGTEVTVWMNGTVQVASVTTSGGKAIFKIEGEAGSTGKAINFKVGSLDAAEEDTWEQGGHVDREFAISVSSKSATTKAPAEPPKAEKGKDGEKGAKGATGAAGIPGKDGAKAVPVLLVPKALPAPPVQPALMALLVPKALPAPPAVVAAAAASVSYL